MPQIVALLMIINRQRSIYLKKEELRKFQKSKLKHEFSIKSV